jgi:hypothetical protein
VKITAHGLIRKFLRQDLELVLRAFLEMHPVATVNFSNRLAIRQLGSCYYVSGILTQVFTQDLRRSLTRPDPHYVLS